MVVKLIYGICFIEESSVFFLWHLAAASFVRDIRVLHLHGAGGGKCDTAVV